MLFEIIAELLGIDEMKGPYGGSVFDALGRHAVHPFPARMAPGIALSVLSESTQRLRVLDPMMGSGTVVAVARSKGHKAFGMDIDPLAVLIARSWTTTIDSRVIEETARHVLQVAQMEYASSMNSNGFPNGADPETRSFIEYWFDRRSRIQLASLAAAIGVVSDVTVRTALWCAFSGLIITKQAGASLAMDLAHSRPHRSYKVSPVVPFEKFLQVVRRVSSNSISASAKDRGPAPVLKIGDARRLDCSNESIDVVVTSPPYLNAIDYIRCSKFSLVWMGHQIGGLRKIRSESIGTEVGYSEGGVNAGMLEMVRALGIDGALAIRHERMLLRYLLDIQRFVCELSRVLRPGGKAVCVIGENTIRGTYVRSSAALAVAAKGSGLRLLSRQERELPANRRYLPPPAVPMANAGMLGRMRREVVLTFEKPLLRWV